MQLVDRIEKRRFVGREFLLWLWFESEVFDATLHTRAHGSFGLWLEKRLGLSAGKESTRITSIAPGQTPQAKAALRAGQLPESAGIRIAWHDDETGFLFKAERLAVGGLKLRPPEEADQAEKSALLEMAPRRPQKTSKRGARKDNDDEAHEAFYERMQLTEEFEALLEALYADFTTLRLSQDWNNTVVPLLRAWARDESIELEAYTALRRPEQTPNTVDSDLATEAQPTSAERTRRTRDESEPVSPAI
jgi:hypothetical protein